MLPKQVKNLKVEKIFILDTSVSISSAYPGVSEFTTLT